MSRRLGMPQVSPHYHGATTNNTESDDAVSLLFDQFCGANTFQGIMSSFQQLCDLLGLKAQDHQQFYRQLKSKVTSWKAQSIWTKLDKRAQHAEYKRCTACTNSRVFIIGAGPCGLRTAIEVALLGGRAVVVEKRDRYSRNSVLHLWPFVIHDLRALAAKKFFGKFCAGSIDHISIRSLQCIMLKVALILGVEIHPGVTYEKIIEPPEDQSESRGWRAQVSPADHPVSEYEFDVLIGADGKRNTLSGFKRKEFRGKLAIAVTANFINRNTEAEARVEEISGVAYIFNQKFFKDLNRKTMIDLENIVYYKDETHYFVMTAKKHSLMYKGVLKQDSDDPEKLLSKENVDQDALLQYALEAADVSTNHQLPNLEFAHNHYGQPDVAMFDFTSMYASHHASRVVERQGHRLLICLVGDSLLEPFWPTGSGCARGFLGAIDAAWMIRSWASGSMTPLEVMAERESVYQLLSQTTPESVSKNFNLWTIDPNTRYVNLNTQFVKSHQVRHLYDGGDPAYLNEIVRISEQKSRRYEWMRDSHNLLKWFMRQLEPYRSVVRVSDMTTSWRSGLALCALIHKYRPELLDVYSLDPNRVQDNNQMAFELAEKEFGIAPLMTGEEMSLCEEPDKFTMVSYLSEFYEYFRKEGIRPAKIARPPGNVIVTKRPKRPRSKSPAHRLAHLNKASHHLRQQRDSSSDSNEQDEREEKENRRREVTKRQPIYTHGMAQKRITDLQTPKQEPPPSKDQDYESVMMENYKRLEGIGPDAPSKLAAVRKEMQLRQHLGGMTVGLRGRNKVSELAKGLAQKFNGETTPPTTRRRLPKPLIVEEPEEKCYFCGNKVYLLERRIAEGYSFHRGCFRCDYCSTNLRLAAYSFLKTDTGQPKFYCVQHVGMSKPFRRPRKRSFGEKDHLGPSVSPILPRQPILQGATTILGRTEPDGLLHKTPERIEYVTESEQEESEFDQTAHNLSGRLDSGNDDSDESSDEENMFGDAEVSDGDVSWAELAQSYSKQLQRSMNKRTGRKRMEDESGTDTATLGGSDADYETESDTEKESDEEVLLRGGKTKGKGQGRNNLQLDPFGNYCPWTKPSPTSLEMMNKRMSFFSAVAEPVRIDARSFLGLTPSLDKMLEEKAPIEDEKADSIGKDDTTPRVSEGEKETQEVKKPAPETGKRAAKGEDQRRKKRKVYRKKGGQVQTQSLSETEEECDQDRRQRRKRYNKYTGKVEADMAAVMQEAAAVVNIEDDLSGSDLEENIQDASEETPTGSLEDKDLSGPQEAKHEERHRRRKDASNELEDESDTTEQDEDESNWKEIESDEILLEPIDVTEKAKTTEKSEERELIIENLDRAVAKLEDTLKQLEQKKPEDYGENYPDDLVDTDEIIKTMQELEELERKRKSFFDQVTEPVRIDAHSFLGLNTEILPESETELQKLEYKELVGQEEDEEEEEASLQMLDDVLNGLAAQETLLKEELTPDTEEMSDDKLGKSESDISQERMQNEGEVARSDAELQEQLEDEKVTEAINEVIDVNGKQEEFVEKSEGEQMKPDDTVGIQQLKDGFEDANHVEEEQPSDKRQFENHTPEVSVEFSEGRIEEITEKEIEVLSGEDDIVEISNANVNTEGVIKEILESAIKSIQSSSSSRSSASDDVEMKMDIDDDRISDLSETVKLTHTFVDEGIKESRTVAEDTKPTTKQDITTETQLPEAQYTSSISEKPILDSSVNLQDTVNIVQANLPDSMDTTTDNIDDIVESNLFGNPPAACLQDTMAIVEKNEHVESMVTNDLSPPDEIHVEEKDIPDTPVSEELLVTISGVDEALPGVSEDVTPVIAKDTVPSVDEVRVENTDIPVLEKPLVSTEQSLPDGIEDRPVLKATEDTTDATGVEDHAMEFSPIEQDKQDILEENVGESILTPVVVEEAINLQSAAEEETIKTETVPVSEPPVIKKESVKSETPSPGDLPESQAGPSGNSDVESEKTTVFKDVGEKEKQLKHVNAVSSEQCRMMQEPAESETKELSPEDLDGDYGQVGVEEDRPIAMEHNVEHISGKETNDKVSEHAGKPTDTVQNKDDVVAADLQETMAIVENNLPSSLLENTMAVVEQNQVETADIDKDISNIVKETLQSADAVDNVLLDKEKKAASKLAQIVDEGIVPLAEAPSLFGADIGASSDVRTPIRGSSASKDIFCSTPILEQGEPVRHILSEDIFASVSPPPVTEPAKDKPSVSPPPVTEPAKDKPSVSPPPVTEPAKDKPLAEEKAELSRIGSVTSVTSEADAIRRIDEMLAKFDSGTDSKSHSRENSVTGSKPAAKKDLVAAVRLEKDLVVIATTATSRDTKDVQNKPETTDKVAEKEENVNKIDESFVNTRDRKKRKQHSGQSDSSSFTISTPSGSVESTSSIPELGSTPAGLSASTTGESLSLGKPTTSKSGGSRSADIQVSSSTEDSFGLDQFALDDSMSLDRLAAAAGLDDDTLSLDRMLDENILPADKSLDDLAEAEIDTTAIDARAVHPSYKSPLDSPETVLPQTPADTTAGDVSQYYTPDISGVTPLSSHGSKGKSSSRQTTPLPQLVIESNSRKSESPRESPSVLLGAAKQKFFFAAAQPLRIDPKTLFENIPQTKEEDKKEKTPLADNTQVSGAGALDLKQGWSELGQTASPTTPTAGVPAADTATGEVDVFYTPATSVKPKQPAKATETKPKEAKKRIVLDVPEKKSSSKPLSTTQESKAKTRGAKPKFRSASDPKKREDVKVKKGKIIGGSLKEKISQPPTKASTRPASAKPDLTHGRSSSSTVSSVEGPQKLATDGATSLSDASPGTRRSRGLGVKKKENRFFSPKRQKSSKSSPVEESKNPPVEKKRRSLLSKLLPSKSTEKKDKTAKSPTETKQRSPLVLRASEKKGKEKSTGKKEKIKTRSKSEDGKKSAEPELRRSMFDEVAPLMDDIMSSERKKKHFADRIEEVAPPPAKAPHTTLKPPRATMDEFETESEFGDDRTSLRSFQSQTQALSPEEMAKILKRQQKAMKKKQHEEELRRLHTAQEIQRHLEELEIKQHEVERRGVAIEKALRGEGPDATADEALLMQEWFNAVHEKNILVRLESELLVHARELELEDRHSRLEQQLRDRLVIDEKDMTAEDREEEQKILHELMEVVEQRNALVTLLEETRLKHEAEERGMRDIVEERGLELSPVPYTHTLRRPSQYDVLNGHR